MTKKDTATLVILHGWGLSKRRFEPLEKELIRRGYNTYSLDFPGFGEEQSPDTPFTLDDYARFLHAYLTRNHITHPIFIGHSFGGRVSLRYNSLYPNVLSGLILTGTPGYTPVPRKKLLVFITVAKIGKLIFSLPGLSLLKDSMKRWYYYVVGAKEFYRAEGSMRQTFKNIVKELLDKDMESLRLETQLIWGENDIIVPLSIARRMNKTIANSQLTIIPSTDHGVPFKHPDLFADEVEKFIKRV